MKLDIKLPVVYHASEHKDDNFPHYILAAGEHAGVRFYVCNINGMHPTAYVRISEGLPIRYRCEVCGLWYMTTQTEHTSIHFCSAKCEDDYYKPTVRRFIRRFMRK